MSMKSPKLRLDAVSKQFIVNHHRRGRSDDSSTLLALDEISFEVLEGELVVIIGPSGCGKSTLLKLVHALMPADAGAIYIDGRRVDKPAFDRALVFQQANLLPWRTALKNVTLGLESMGVPKDERNERAMRRLELVGLAGYENYFPHQLSGGMQQRVGLARALALDPEILLMDEPFGALDAQTRERLQQELLRILDETTATVLFVTHDLDEAVYLGDRVVVLTPGPGRIAEIIDVDIPRPRPRPGELRANATYVAVRNRLWELLDQGPS